MPEDCGQFVHALALRLRPEWRLLGEVERSTSASELVAALDSGQAVTTLTYSMIGLHPGADVLIWRLAPSVELLEDAAATLLRTGLGRWLVPTHSMVGLVRPSPYVNRRKPDQPALFAGERMRYLVVYPFTKTAEWYLLDRDHRQAVMNEHIKVGHRHAGVRQLLANSFGLDDMDFLVAYETDSLAVFSELVRQLRETQSRRFTLRDTPLLAAVHRPMTQIVEMLGAPCGNTSAANPLSMTAGTSTRAASPSF